MIFGLVLTGTIAAVLLATSVGALAFKAKPEITITYSKIEQIVTWYRPKSQESLWTSCVYVMDWGP